MSPIKLSMNEWEIKKFFPEVKGKEPNEDPTFEESDDKGNGLLYFNTIYGKRKFAVNLSKDNRLRRGWR